MDLEVGNGCLQPAEGFGCEPQSCARLRGGLGILLRLGPQCTSDPVGREGFDRAVADLAERLFEALERGSPHPQPESFENATA